MAQSRRNDFVRVLLIIVMGAAMAAVLPKQRQKQYTYEIGRPWASSDLLASRDFPILKTDLELKAERMEALKNYHPLYKIDSVAQSATQSKLTALVANNASPEAAKALGSSLKATLSNLYAYGIYQPDSSLLGRDSAIYLKEGPSAKLTPITTFLSPQAARLKVIETLSKIQAVGKDSIDFNSLIGLNILTPNVIPHENALQFKQDAMSVVLPVKGLVQAGQKIITRGQIVGAEELQLLTSMQAQERLESNNIDKVTSYLGGALVTYSVLILFIFFIYKFRPNIYGSLIKLIVLLTNILVALVLIKLIAFQTELNHYIVPLCSLAVISRALFDVRVAVFSHIVVVLLASLIVSNPLEFALVELLAGMTAVFTLVNIRKRAQFFFTSGWVFLMYCAVYTGLAFFFNSADSQFNLTNYAWFAVSSFLTLLAYPLVYVYERVFGLTSDVTLMELTDANSTLLRELSIKAPGTFTHSTQVANMAEEAILLLGGNTVLTRVGALYHDIGKMQNPLYFTENQLTDVNPHDELSPEESAQVIINHVYAGIQMAKDHGLPEEVIDFIRTHHGTTRVEYFYQAMKVNQPGELISTSQFQYPGPPPYSKETAVVMLADTVEATSRSMPQIDAAMIKQIIDRSFERLIENGQFENADLSFKDIALVKKTFERRLASIYHLRVEYPKSA